jgi:hypothetical protein
VIWSVAEIAIPNRTTLLQAFTGDGPRVVQASNASANEFSLIAYKQDVVVPVLSLGDRS